MQSIEYYPGDRFWKEAWVLYCTARWDQFWPSSCCWYIPQFGTWECN